MPLTSYRSMNPLGVSFGSIYKLRLFPIRFCSSVPVSVDTTSSRKAAPISASTSTSTSTSLAWVQVHNVSPASYGLDTWSGYEEMIGKGEPLPTKKFMKLRGSIFEYYERDRFVVSFRRFLQDAPVMIDTVELTNIRKAPAEDTITNATMEIDKTLKGRLSVQDPYTKSEASILFDAGVACQSGVMLESGMSKSLVTKG